MVEHDHELSPVCAAAREEFSALLDDELAPAARTMVEAHLAECSDCLRALDNMKKVTDLYRALPSVPAPAGFEDSVRKALRPAVVAFPQRARTIGLLALAAAAGLALMIVPFALRDSQRSVNRQLARDNAEMRSAPEAAANAVPEQKVAPGAERAEAPKDAARKEQLEALGYLGDEKAKSEAAAPTASAMPNLQAPKPVPAPPSIASAPAPAQATARAMKGEPEPKQPGEAAQLKESDQDAVGARVPALAEEAAAPAPVVAMAAPAAPPPPPAPEPAPILRAEPPMAKSAAEVPKADAAAAESVPTTAVPSTSHVHGKPWKTAGRKFELQDEVWIQKGYDNAPTTALTAGAREFNDLAKQFPELKQLMAADKPVVFKAGNTWYRLTPRKK